MKETYSNALGYGFWCPLPCAEEKIRQGIPPLGARRGAKLTEAEAQELLSKAAGDSASNQQTFWTPVATTGVVVVSLLTIGLIAVIIKKQKRKKA
tara:strand:+ start:23 stop:307 length:285 start_codon:yes stop_codon:yes gene_type:complete